MLLEITIVNSLLTIILVLICVYFRNYLRLLVMAMHLPGPPAYPLIGHCYLINQPKELERIGSDPTKYSPLGRGWLSFLPLIFVYEPRHLKIILANSKLSKKNFFYTFLHNFVGEGLITNNDYKWKKNRKLIQPYFAINVLESFVGIFVEHAEKTFEMLENYPENADVKISNVTNECIVKILHQAVLGLTSEDETMLKASPFRQGHTPFSYRIAKPWLMLEKIFQYTSVAKSESDQKRNLQNYARKVLKNRLLDLDNGVKGSNCLLNMLIEICSNNEIFTEEDIVNEACTFMLAGQDSVGSATAFTLYYLAKHQDIQARVYDELQTVLANKNRNESLTIDQLNNMKYLEQCVKETLRLAPSIPLIARALTEDVKLDEYVFPKGTNIIVSPFATHRLAHIFPDPLKFDPDRFSAENAPKIHPFGFLPFSLGARNCIGYKFAYLEIKTIIAIILERYQVLLSPGKEQLDLTYKVTLRTKGGVSVRLKSRQ